MNQNSSEFFRWDPVYEEYGNFDQILTRSFTMSYMFIGTAFEPNLEDISSAAFDAFSANRIIISDRLASQQTFTDSLS